VIEFHNKYATQATIEAFGCAIFYYLSLETAFPKSTTPKTKRERIWHPEGNVYVERFNGTLEEYIEYMREELREETASPKSRRIYTLDFF